MFGLVTAGIFVLTGSAAAQYAGNAIVTGSHFTVRDCQAQGYDYNVNPSLAVACPDSCPARMSMTVILASALASVSKIFIWSSSASSGSRCRR